MLLNEDFIPLRAAADIAGSHVSVIRERLVDDVGMLCLALAKTAPVYCGTAVLDGREAEERLCRSQPALDGLRVRRDDLRAAVSALRESVLLSALQLLESRAALTRSWKLLSG